MMANKVNCQIQDLYRQLVEGDVTASSRLADLLLPRLVAHLRRQYADGVEEAIKDAAIDAIVDLIRQPDIYDVNKGLLLNFLKTVAVNRLIDLHRRRMRVARREYSVGLGIGSVMAGGLSGFVAGESRDCYDVESLHHAAMEVLPEPKDRELFHLICNDQGDWSSLAAVLKITDRPEEEQKQVAKRHRDRIMKRVARRGFRLEGKIAKEGEST